MVGALRSLVILARFCDLVVCGEKNENHDFITLGGLNPLKCFQTDMEKLLEQKESIFVWLMHSKFS